MFGIFSTFLGGALLPLTLLAFGIGYARPEAMASFSELGSIPLLPLIGLGLASFGLSLCWSFERVTPVSCWFGVILNTAVFVVLWLI